MDAVFKQSVLLEENLQIFFDNHTFEYETNKEDICFFFNFQLI
jgi:hypothetical protein